MRVSSAISHACSAAFAAGCALLVIAGCGETTHSVGRLKAGQTIDEPRGGSAGAGAALGAPSSGKMLQVPHAAGAPIDGVDDAGIVVGTQDGGVVHTLSIAYLACKGPTIAAARRELDLYLMVDNNITLPDPRAWTNLLQGLNRYVNDKRAAGTGIGIDYFGLDCDINTYATPTVPLGLLPGNARAITASFAQLPVNVSPMLPAMQGALRYAKSAASAFPKLKLAVVLITDGISDLMCGPATSLTQVTKDGLDGDPSIPSYMVAVDAKGTFSLDMFNPAARFDPLDEMAVAGGTASARHVDVLSEPTPLMNNDPSPFADAMVAIQREAEPCDYAVPVEVPDDANGVWLARDDSTPITKPLARVPSIADCAADRYYFSTDRSVRWATLCPALCDDVKQHRSTLLWVEGCP